MENKPIRFYIFFSVFLSSVSLFAQKEFSVQLKSGAVNNTLLSSVSNVSFSGNNLMVNKSDNSSSSFDFSSIRKITFTLSSGTTVLQDDQTHLVVYPNPATDFIRIKNGGTASVHLVVYQMDGKMVLTKDLADASDPVDVSGLSSGFYFVLVNNVAVKFSKQ